MDSTEAELIERAQKGDKSAFGALVRLHQKRVYACAVSVLGDQTQAEDAVQETFIRAFRAMARFDGRSELSTWLYRICVNVCLNQIRKRKRHRAADMDDPRVPEPAADPLTQGADPHRTVEERDFQKRIWSAVDSLSESLRATVVLVLIQGVSHQDAAVALGCPEGTIAWRIHEARRKLRDLVFGGAASSAGATDSKDAASSKQLSAVKRGAS